MVRRVPSRQPRFGRISRRALGTEHTAPKSLLNRFIHLVSQHRNSDHTDFIPPGLLATERFGRVS